MRHEYDDDTIFKAMVKASDEYPGIRGMISAPFEAFLGALPERADRWLATVEAAAEQRGSARELRQAALERSRAGNDANVYAWLHYRADRIADKEGDDE